MLALIILVAMVFSLRFLTPPVVKEVTRTETVVLEKLTTVTVVRVANVSIGNSEDYPRILRVCFSPYGGCSKVLISLFSRANESIYVMIYSFTLDGVAEALIQAVNRGVDVRVVIEERNAFSRGSEYQRLLENGVSVRLDGNPSLMHNKVAIIDGQIVITGSMNWSFSGDTRNDENIIVIQDPQLAESYLEEFNRIWAMAS